jgi:hypothetical protein
VDELDKVERRLGDARIYLEEPRQIVSADDF